MSSVEDLPQTVRHRLSELPDDLWAGELADVECSHCGHNSWCETDDDLGYADQYKHAVTAYECLYCGATGGLVADMRTTTGWSERLVGALESTRETFDGLDPDNLPWEVDDGESE